MGNLQFKAHNYAEADVYFEKAHQSFESVDNLVGLIQLHITVARLNLQDSRKYPCQEEIDKAKELASRLSNSEQVMETLQELEKMLERIDRI